MNLSKTEQNRWKQHYKQIKKQSDSVKKSGSTPIMYDIRMDHVGMVLAAIACFRYSVFRSRHLYRFIPVNNKRGLVRAVMGALCRHGFVMVYDTHTVHGNQYQRLFDLDEIPDVIREVCL